MESAPVVAAVVVVVGVAKLVVVSAFVVVDTETNHTVERAVVVDTESNHTVEPAVVVVAVWVSPNKAALPMSRFAELELELRKD